MKKTVLSAAFGALAMGVAFASPSQAADVSACLITKTDTNPFIREDEGSAAAKAKELASPEVPMPARSTVIPKARSLRSRPALPMAPRVS